MSHAGSSLASTVGGGLGAADKARVEMVPATPRFSEPRDATTVARTGDLHVGPGTSIMDRIAVVGCGGSGKTIFAHQLGAALGITPTHLDAEFYDQDWAPRPPEQFTARQNELVNAPRWVIVLLTGLLAMFALVSGLFRVW
jgi:hypothetical protein